jgi:hypothetical protein
VIFIDNEGTHQVPVRDLLPHMFDLAPEPG